MQWHLPVLQTYTAVDDALITMDSSMEVTPMADIHKTDAFLTKYAPRELMAMYFSIRGKYGVDSNNVDNTVNFNTKDKAMKHIVDMFVLYWNKTTHIEPSATTNSDSII